MNFLSVQTQGAIYTVVLFVVCAVLVHAFRLAKIGYKSMKKRPADKDRAAPETKGSEKTDAVYYIVERKKKRQKAEYSDPKRISFK